MRRVGRVVVLVRTGLVMGAVMAALAYPLAAVVGLGVKASMDQLDSQAQQLPDLPPAQASRVYAADGTTLISEFSDGNRAYTPLAHIPPAVTQAVVAAEDAHFYDQHAAGVKDIVRAFVTSTAAGSASPLTMRYVRTVLRDSARTPQELQAATADTSARALRETQLAVAVEQKLSKAQILERYLNVVYFGHQAYGIAVAARLYFATSPADLTLSEAAMLAGLIQEPTADDQQPATSRRDQVLDRMVALHYVTRAAADQARTEAITAHVSDPPGDCASAAQSGWGYFCDLFTSWWMAQPAFGASPQERLNRLRRGGYRIVTSLDVRLQDSAQRHLTAKEPAGSAFAHGLVAIEPGTGRVRAMSVNRAYSAGQSTDAYPAGATFDLATMLAAVEGGLPLATSINAPRQTTMWTAFGTSAGSYFSQLEQRVGADKVAAMAERLGLRSRTGTTPLELADAYATIAADGSYCDPLPVVSIADPDGAPVIVAGDKPVEVAAPRCRQAVPPQVARAAADAARCVTGYGAASAGVCTGRPTAASVYPLVKRPVAGKTGAADNDRAAWFVGVTPTLAVASFIADPTNPQHAVGAANRDKPVRSVAETLRDGLAGSPVRGFAPPDRAIAYGPSR